MLIQEKKIEIGSMVLVWDWFEACKWLSFLSGVFITLGILSFALLYFGKIKSVFVGVGLIVCFFGLFSVLSFMVKLIRDDVK